MAFSGNYALAQITPDQTLGNESSVVTPNLTIRGEPGDLIEGGAVRGSNLFHSFQDFNVGQLQRVYFANPAGIENILSRVTGSNISNILGTLGVDVRTAPSVAPTFSLNSQQIYWLREGIYFVTRGMGHN
ncbi:MAG: filamentous hemagglutinin N-terminal domain-containing protein [Moorea sp. SIOASIH]|nr:filamentous hemagglutinin N-terminal domain-containing protein [Moorena sp. SIOASIH]